MTQMIREMRQSLLDDEDTEGLGAAALTDTADVELGRALSAGRGFGLAESLLKVFERQLATPAGAAGNHDASTLTPAIVAEPLTQSAAPASVNSNFGWRMDPISGRPRFHKGIDIAAAYGANVEAADGGRVVFAGVQGSYGETILIDHGAGRQTRYAHLSERLVEAGNHVQAGQLIGRAGSSGRSTGPHLHFEVLVDGRPVDPTPKGLAQIVD
jgi:murein DD-endopeptidase MepM/ murein hydrolase activator NlpD